MYRTFSLLYLTVGTWSSCELQSCKKTATSAPEYETDVFHLPSVFLWIFFGTSTTFSRSFT